MRKLSSIAAVLLVCMVITSLFGCNSKSHKSQEKELVEKTPEIPTLFSRLTPEQSGIHFRNPLHEDKVLNFFNYTYIYHGGGVAIGDLNNDGLDDLYFVANLDPNTLYLNKGNLKFEDITQTSGTAGKGGWCVGVTMADVNSDGFLDIYVSRSYDKENPKLRENLLYINNGDLTFSEQAQKYGINDASYTSQATFFDYDKDGDPDLYLANHLRDFSPLGQARVDRRLAPAEYESDKLYRNDGETFTDVTKEAGLLQLGFGLSATVGDLNNDGWPDLYVANDLDEPDCFYLNNGDGTFSNQIDEAFKHISFFSMGADIADFNNDGLLDILVLDMMPEDNSRQKTMMAGMNPKGFWGLVDFGYHYQFMRNVLQLNNGDGTFSEIAYQAGLPYTDWSWGGLFADFDNDGLKDLVVSNGLRRDTRDKDFRNQMNDLVEQMGGGLDYNSTQKLIPVTKVSNYIYKNNGDYTFSKKMNDWGFDYKGFSNGMAYSDLDNDGDLDLVLNNLEAVAMVYENNLNQQTPSNYLSFSFKGPEKNPFGLGVKVELKTDDQVQVQEVTLTRGFQSSVAPKLHFGLGKLNAVDQISILWPDGKTEIMKEVKANEKLIAKYENAGTGNLPDDRRDSPPFKNSSALLSPSFVHQENEYDDYAKEILLPHKMSQFGPGLSTGDVNNDRLDDFFVGGASGQPGALYLQQPNGSFRVSSNQPWKSDKDKEDLGSLFFDADGDGDKDLYVVSGGNEFPDQPEMLQDRLYLNNGAGRFSKSNYLPEITTSGSCVVAGDYDQDGDPDLFIGGRVVCGKYPFPARSYILQNQNGKFTDVTETVAPGLLAPGLVTSAVWTDFDGNNSLDLIVVGEWMPVTIFRNAGGTLENITESAGLPLTEGWWNKIAAADMDGDGDEDYIIGNLGLNYKYTASESEPLHVYCHDFDQSGTLDIALGYYNNGKCFPVRGRQCSSEQVPSIKKKFGTYKDFGAATLSEVYGTQLEEALHLKSHYFRTAYLENTGKGKFRITALPNEAQFAPTFGIIPFDFDKDGMQDLLLGGNFYASEVETGRVDAGRGLYLSGNGDGTFNSQIGLKSGFVADKDVKDMAMVLNSQGNPVIIVANNNDELQLFSAQFTKPSDRAITAR